MEEFHLYKDIKARTGGEIFLGVVGPVRTGKSTFVRHFMELLVLPNLKDQEKRIATELSELERQVLDLYITGMSYTQIAKVLRRSEKATENALTRAKQKIRVFLSKESKF